MTDEQIIKALDDVAKRGFKLCGLALDLINRQKAEIERLTEENKKTKIILDGIEDAVHPLPFETDYDKAIKRAESEAIREFAERIDPIIEELVDIMFDGNEPKCRIKNCHKHSSISCDSPTCIEENKAYWKLKIYNLVEEMVGDSE